MYRRIPYLLSLLLALLPAMAQTTTNFSGTFTLTDQPDNERFFTNFFGTGQVGTLGTALLSMSRNQQLADDGISGVGQSGGGLRISFNRLDTIFISLAGIPDPTQASITVTGRINTGTGAYANISNPAPSGPTVTVTMVRTSTSPLGYNLSVTGNAVLNGQTISLAITNVPFTQSNTLVNVFGTSTGTGTLTPFGDVQVSANVTPGGGRTFQTSQFIDIIVTMTLSQADSIKFFFTLVGETPPPNVPFTITGGTGAYAGASGSGTLNLPTQDSVTVAGSVTKASPTTPVITSVGTASYPMKRIAQNDWIFITGTNLVPANTPAGGMYWSNAPEFAQGKMPTQVGGISVTVNGKPSYVWWFCSAATTPACAQDQINVLTPLDDAADQLVMVVVKNGSDSSAPFLVPKDEVNPSVLTFDTLGHAVATHPDGSLLGPTSLYPGLSTPGKGGETVTLWSVGFGLPATSLEEGSATQSGSLPSTPACTLGGASVQVVAVLVSPGLYILNITIPDNAVSGDNFFYCTYNNAVLPGSLVAVQ
jgi:uncharacterized protein (TIGR03437 family)